MGGNIIMKWMFFSNTHRPQLTAPFYSILFETSICQFNSSKFSPIMPDEVKEHLTRNQRPFLHPESLQILQIHSSMTVLLLFSSPHSFSTGFRSEDWNGHSRSLVLCSVTHFCVDFEVCVWIIVRLEDPNMAHYMWLFLTESVTCWFFICWYLIESWCHISKQDVQDLQQKYRPTTYKYISLYTWVLFIPVFTKPILSVCC